MNKTYLIVGGVVLFVIVVLFLIYRTSQVKIEQAQAQRANAELLAYSEGNSSTNVWDVINTVVKRVS